MGGGDDHLLGGQKAPGPTPPSYPREKTLLYAKSRRQEPRRSPNGGSRTDSFLLARSRLNERSGGHFWRDTAGQEAM